MLVCLDNGLECLDQRKIAQNEDFLIKRLVNLKLREGCIVAKHLSDFQDIVNSWFTLVLALGEELQALFLLSSLADS